MRTKKSKKPRVKVVLDGGVVESIPKLKIIIDKLRAKYGEKIIYRGQPDYAWQLEPSIAREYSFYSDKKKLKKESEINLLDRFHRIAAAYLDKDLNPWDLLFYARHHGLPVRILDWTSNPLVALYFSAEYKEKAATGVDGSLWVCFLNNKPPLKPHTSDDKNRDPSKVQGIRLIYPTHACTRVNAQEGVFSLHGNPWAPLEDFAKKYRGKQSNIKALIKLKIPADNKINIFDELDRFGVSQRTIFPDLDGAAKGVLNNEFLRP